MYYKRELSHVCGYTRELDLPFYENEILHIYGYCKTILFQRLRVTSILVDHKTSCVEKVISLAFHAYKECPNQRSYVSCVNFKARWLWTLN
jgi:hypothetical protein